MLTEILKETSKYFLDMNQPYLAVLYRAIFTASYYGLLRVGEVTSGDHPIAAKDVLLGINKDKILFTLRTSKTHWLDEKPQIIKISSSKKGNQRANKMGHCPYEILRKFINTRIEYESDSEPFFIFNDRTPVKPANANRVLKDILRRKNFNPNLYSMHSFRSGRAVDLLNAGFSVETIKKIGRWKSNCVYVYLK